MSLKREKDKKGKRKTDSTIPVEKLHGYVIREMSTTYGIEDKS